MNKFDLKFCLMNRILVIVCFLLTSLCAMAQIDKHSYVSTTQTGGRFEIIQSPIARRLIFRLDKYTGDVYQYVLGKDNKPLWEKISNAWLSLILDKEKKQDYIKFQLFMGGIAVADCFLLDIETGVTFQLYEDPNSKKLFFYYISNAYSDEENK